MEIPEWKNVKDELPKHGNGSFLAWWETQNLMLLCFVNIHGNYIIAGSSGETCGHGDYPKFSHWMLAPEFTA